MKNRIFRQVEFSDKNCELEQCVKDNTLILMRMNKKNSAIFPCFLDIDEAPSVDDQKLKLRKKWWNPFGKIESQNMLGSVVNCYKCI